MPVTLHKVVVGSRLYGLAHEDSDYDCKGLFINDFDDIYPKPEQYFGVRGHKPLETIEFDNKETGKNSINGVLHNVRKFIQLSAVGNPTLLEVSFVPDEFVLETTHYARDVTQFVQDNCLTKKAISSYVGYFFHEKKQAEKAKNLKSAAHAIRIAHQALQISTDKYLNPCLTGELHQKVRDIRAGVYSWEQLDVEFAEMDFKLQKAEKTNELPDQVDPEKMNSFLINFHTAYYKELGYLP